MNSFVTASVGLLVFIVVLMVFMPIANLLMSIMAPDLGASTIFVIGTIPIVLIASAIYLFVLKSNEPDSYSPTGSFK